MNQRQQDINLSTFAGQGVSTQINYVRVSDTVSIRCIEFTPQATDYPTVLFIPGWISLLNSWRYFLPKVTTELHLIFMETREKSSSRVDGKASFSVDDISGDISKVIDHFKLKNNEYILAGSSLGATAILNSYPNLSSTPMGMVLILPNSSFYLPTYTPILKIVPPFLLPIMRWVAKWIMLKTKINPNDIEHQDRFLAAINSANATRLRDSALAVYAFELNLEKLEQIQIPCLVIGASKDGEHDQDDIREIVSRLPFAEYLDLVTFTATHSRRGAEALLSFVKQLYAEEKIKSCQNI